MTSNNDSGSSSWLSSRSSLVCLGFLAIAAFFLIAEHRAHLLGILPFILLLLCPLLHLLHGGHGGDSGGHDHSREGDKR
jgi:hypothetical protein